jgi:lysophospholipase L1-like esterase
MTVLSLVVLLVLVPAVLLMRNASEDRQASGTTETYTPPSQPTVVFLGDSFTMGAGADPQTNRWTTLLSRAQGWKELNYGYGGTNYATAGELEGAMPYVDRVPDIVADKPDIVIVSTAGNSVEVNQTADIERTLQGLREGLPDARILATSPYVRAGEYPSSLTVFGAQIRTAVESVGGEYLDIGHPLGDHPEAMADDGSHPNNTGHMLIADAVQSSLE